MSEAENSFNPETQQSLQKIMGVMRELRDNWQDGIPREIKHSVADENGTINWKVRHSWFQQIIWAYEELEYILGNHFPGEVKEKFYNFNEQTISKLDKLTTPEDVAAGDEFLNFLIDYLEKELNK